MKSETTKNEQLKYLVYYNYSVFNQAYWNK